MYQQSPITFQSGINPEPDDTEQNTVYIIDGNNIRFYRNGVEKIGGHSKAALDTDIDGCPRNTLTFEAASKKWQIVGTHSKLYAILGSEVTNITPLKTTAEATLSADPIDTVASDATVTVNYTAHGLSVGDRFKLTGSSGVGGINHAEINKEHIVATVPDADSFTFEAGANALSTASGGGASIEIFYEIADGACSAAAATGPGIGTPGLGLPGSIQTDTSLLVQPRIWWLDTYGDTLVCGPGQGGKCYQWSADTDVAPAIISNAPDADWGWVEDAKLCVWDGNTLANSDTGNITNWSSGSYQSDAKEEVTQFVARAYVNGENILFSEEGKAFTYRFVGGTLGWRFRKIDSPISITGPNGYYVLGGRLFVFGRNNLFLYNGGTFETIPNNTVFKYLYDDINLDQRYKCLIWYNRKYSELNFHYPSSNSDENDRCIVYSITEGWFSKRENIDRTAADDTSEFSFPLLFSSAGDLYQHEVGRDDDDSALNAFFQIAYQAAANGSIYSEISGMEIDLIQTGNMTVELYGKDRSRGPDTLIESFTVEESTRQIECEHDIRWRSWLCRSNTLGGFFRVGQGALKEYIEAGSEY